jgi:hypothetical protein
VKFDPSLSCTTYTINLPPSVGPGSGKAAWKALAFEELNANLTAVIEEQRETIRDLEAELRLLRRQIAARKPKGRREQGLETASRRPS